MSTSMCQVDRRGDSIWVQVDHRTESGFWIAPESPERLPADASAGDLGQAVMDALGRSRQDVADPARDADLSAPLRAAVGVSSYAEYARGTKSVLVYEDTTADERSIEVTPTANGGQAKGFTPIEESIIEFGYDSPSQVGKAVLEALERSK